MREFHPLIRWRFVGDETACRALIPTAMTFLGRFKSSLGKPLESGQFWLEQSRRLAAGKVRPTQIGASELRLEDGSVISVQTVSGIDFVSIQSMPEAYQPEAKTIPLYRRIDPQMRWYGGHLTEIATGCTTYSGEWRHCSERDVSSGNCDFISGMNGGFIVTITNEATPPPRGWSNSAGIGILEVEKNTKLTIEADVSGSASGNRHAWAFLDVLVFPKDHPPPPDPAFLVENLYDIHEYVSPSEHYGDVWGANPCDSSDMVKMEEWEWPDNGTASDVEIEVPGGGWVAFYYHILAAASHAANFDNGCRPPGWVPSVYHCTPCAEVCNHGHVSEIKMEFRIKAKLQPELEEVGSVQL